MILREIGTGKRVNIKQKKPTYDEILFEIERIKHLQCVNTSCNDPYMVGMYNGMECIYATLKGREPNYLSVMKKKKWWKIW